MADKDFGRSSGIISVGTVVNRKDDPSQSGRLKVRWETGGLSQADMQESDLRWSPTLFHSANPSASSNTQGAAGTGPIGGPHTGLLEGSKVYGIPVSADGQTMLIIGAAPAAGNAQPDGSPTFDSNIPAEAKSQSNGGENQPRYGDTFQPIATQSAPNYAEQNGGGTQALSAKLNDPIGGLAAILGPTSPKST